MFEIVHLIRYNNKQDICRFYVRTYNTQFIACCNNSNILLPVVDMSSRGSN